MSTYPDQHGLMLTCQSAKSARLFDDTVTAYLGFKKETGNKLKFLIEEAPDMPMAICLRGYLTKLVGNRIANEKAQTVALSLKDMINGTLLSDREIFHCRALDAWVDGQLDDALYFWETILSAHPTDTLALRLAHHFHFYSGNGRRMTTSLSQVLPFWNESQPHFGYVLGMHAFGLEECGDYENAEKFGRQAVELNPEDAWSAHAVAHVFEMNERHEEGISWVNSLSSNWSDVNNFRFHIYWHQSLYHLERMEYEEALSLYDSQIASDLAADFSLDMCNAASLLYRFELFDIEVGLRWNELAEVARHHIDDSDMVFTSIHYLIALISDDNKNLADKLFKKLNLWAEQNTTQGRICKQVGIGLADALMKLKAGELEQAVDILMKQRKQISKIGGSIAQRDLFQLILLHAASQGQTTDFALELFTDRTQHKPKSLWTWHQYSNLLKQRGDLHALDNAQAQIERLCDKTKL